MYEAIYGVVSLLIELFLKLIQQCFLMSLFNGLKSAALVWKVKDAQLFSIIVYLDLHD